MEAETCQKNRKKTWLHQQMGEPNIWVGGPNIWGPNPRGAEYLAAESEFPNHGNGKREPDSYHTSKPPTQITRISNNKKTKRSNTMDSDSIRSLNKFQMSGEAKQPLPQARGEGFRKYVEQGRFLHLKSIALY